MRVEWEWDRHSSAAAPYVGRIRFCFTREPEFDSSFEPLGAVDLTQLPAIGAFVRDSLRAQLIASAVWPNWVETDWREYLVPPKTPAPMAALYYK
jgi:Ca2+-dependent lipid-binding protein